VLATVRRDVRAVLERDPAARGPLEVVLCYPTLWAVFGHRVAHRLWRSRLKLPARLLATVMRGLTGVEIHPGAEIGPGFFVDHGMGVVIGETATVGTDVTLYHGVTLGGTSSARGKRHPTIGDRVVVGAGAKILGAIEVGEGSRIGANAVVVRAVPAGAVVVGVPGEIVARGNGRRRRPDLEHAELPDVLGDAVTDLLGRVERLEEELGGEAHEAPFTRRRGVWVEVEDFSI
jgi:serine O-acetyltransferase